METIAIGFELARRGLFRAGPYLLLEMVLPGGTMVALLLYLYRRQAKKSAGYCRSDTSWHDYKTGTPDCRTA